MRNGLRAVATGHVRAACCTVFLVCVFAVQVAAQPEVPAFDVEYVSVRDASQSGQTRVDVYTKIPYSNLAFINRNGSFEARYEVAAEIFRVNNRGRAAGRVKSENWDRRLTATDFSYTQSDQVFDFATHSILLRPGEYAIQITVEDQSSNRTFLRELPVTVRDFSSDPVTMSDVLVVDEYDRSRNTISPNVSNEIESDKREVTFFYEVYATAPSDVQVNYRVQQVRTNRQRTSVRTLLGIRPDDEDVETSDISQWKSQPLSLKAGRNPATVSVPMNEFQAGTYAINITLKDKNRKTLASAGKVFDIRWAGLQAQIRDVDKAIQQLRYVAKDDEIRAILSEQGSQARLGRFTDFWMKRDPTPGTRRNEAMEEYYFRIKHVNDRFGLFQEGWRTDQGEVYIRFGEPSYVQRHLFDFGSSKPYEIWYYNTIGRKFIFIDDTGVGDYRLLRPIWDESTRM